MLPTLQPGDYCLLAPVRLPPFPGETLAIAAPSGSTVIVHRFICYYKIRGRRFMVTKGDNATRFDFFEDNAALLGRVVCVRRQQRLIDLSGFTARFRSCGHWLQGYGFFIVCRCRGKINRRGGVGA